jgi:hypothetical protein
MLKLLACLFLIVVVTSNFLLHPAPDLGTPSAKTAQYFSRGLAATIHRLSDLENAASSGKNASLIRTRFLQARWAYKQVEALVEYYYPHLVRNIMGPHCHLLMEKTPSACLNRRASRYWKSYCTGKRLFTVQTFVNRSDH